MSDQSVQKYVDPETLIPYGNNSKIHSDEVVKELADSMAAIGFNRPVSIDENNTILAGHKSVRAAVYNKQKGIDGFGEIPVYVASGLTDAQRRAFILAENRHNEKSDWDFDLVSSELESLQLDGFDIDLTGFDDGFILKEPEEGNTDEDAVPDVPDEPVTVLGDVWLMGEHRLMCGDSLSVDAMDILMRGTVADMVFTDPPYGVSYQSNMRVKSEKFEVIENDDQILDIAPTLEIYSTGWMFIWTTWKVLNKWIEQTASFGYPTNMVVWSKGGGGIGDLKKTFSTDYEVALVFNRGAELKGKRIGSVWKIGKDKAIEYKHPTQKPVELAEEAIDKTTDKGATILDIFGGSGSTLIACQKIGRKCLTSELSEGYCDVIINRWQDYTGKQATLEGDGRTFDEIKADRIGRETEADRE